MEILPEGAICVAYKRNANLKEPLAPSNPFKRRSPTEPTGCFKCKAKRCDCCKKILEEGSTFISGSSGRVFQIGKFLTCTSDNVVYLARCVACGLQGVGSTINFKIDLLITSLISNVIRELVVLLITSCIVIMLIIHC